MHRTMREFAFDGQTALQAVISQSEYGSLEQAVASLSIFSNPETVIQVRAKNLFSVIRAKAQQKKGEHAGAAGDRVMLDDNLSPIMAFTWANDIARGRDLQYNHIVSMSDDVSLYTNLANIVALPAFLSKPTDTHKTIKSILFHRSLELYGNVLLGQSPSRPVCYDSLKWSDPLPAVRDVESVVRKHMATKPKNRTVISARNIGWLFSNYQPDSSV